MFFFTSLLRIPSSSTGNIILGAICSSSLIGASSFPALNVLTQRWKYRARKPIGSPRSRKKRYYVRVPTPWDPYELNELGWRTAHQATSVRAIKNYLAKWKEEAYPEVQVDKTEEVKSFVMDPEFKLALEENEFENARVSELREARYKEIVQFHENERRRVYQEFVLGMEEERSVRDQQVREKKEVVRNLVTADNLDERIAFALDNPISFDFAIDLKGRRVEGRPDPLKDINMFYPKQDRLVEQQEPVSQRVFSN